MATRICKIAKGITLVLTTVLAAVGSAIYIVASIALLSKILASNNVSLKDNSEE